MLTAEGPGNACGPTLACAQGCIAAANALEQLIPTVSALPIIGQQLAVEYFANAQLLRQAGSLSQTIVNSGTQLQTTYTNYSNRSAYDSQLATQVLALPPATVIAPTSSNGTTQNFNSPVTSEQPMDVDPVLASGYIFKTGPGDPNFSTVTLPILQGLDENYTIQVADGSTWLTVGTVDPLQTFVFGPDGVNDFRVLLSDFQLSLDETLLPFVTQLTFLSDGYFTGSITAIVESAVPTPEPPTLILLGSGLFGLGLVGSRKRRIRREGCQANTVALGTPKFLTGGVPASSG